MKSGLNQRDGLYRHRPLLPLPLKNLGGKCPTSPKMRKKEGKKREKRENCPPPLNLPTTILNRSL